KKPKENRGPQTVRERIDTTKGILRPDRGRGRYRVERYVPADDLKPFIERHWIVRWRLPAGESFEQELLAHPCVNMVLERGSRASSAWPPGAAPASSKEKASPSG